MCVLNATTWKQYKWLLKGLKVVLDRMSQSISFFVLCNCQHPMLTGFWTSAGLPSPPKQCHRSKIFSTRSRFEATCNTMNIYSLWTKTLWFIWRCTLMFTWELWYIWLNLKSIYYTPCPVAHTWSPLLRMGPTVWWRGSAAQPWTRSTGRWGTARARRRAATRAAAPRWPTAEAWLRSRHLRTEPGGRWMKQVWNK